LAAYCAKKDIDPNYLGAIYSGFAGGGMVCEATRAYTE
jgi:hypothetical protein